MSDPKQEAIEQLATTVRDQYKRIAELEAELEKYASPSEVIEHLRNERNEWSRRFKKIEAENKRLEDKLEDYLTHHEVHHIDCEHASFAATALREVQ